MGEPFRRFEHRPITIDDTGTIVLVSSIISNGGDRSWRLAGRATAA